MKILKKRSEMEQLWNDKPEEKKWRKDLRVLSIVDAKDFNGEWKIGSIVAVGTDPNLILVAFNGQSLLSAEYFCRYVFLFWY